jgi:hypothetical protein
MPQCRRTMKKSARFQAMSAAALAAAAPAAP